jgi:hypothetical protein
MGDQAHVFVVHLAKVIEFSWAVAFGRPLCARSGPCREVRF